MRIWKQSATTNELKSLRSVNLLKLLLICVSTLLFHRNLDHRTAILLGEEAWPVTDRPSGSTWRLVHETRILFFILRIRQCNHAFWISAYFASQTRTGRNMPARSFVNANC